MIKSELFVFGVVSHQHPEIRISWLTR